MKIFRDTRITNIDSLIIPLWLAIAGKLSVAELTVREKRRGLQQVHSKIQGKSCNTL